MLSPLSVAPPPSSPSPNLASFMSSRPPPAQQQQQQHAPAITCRISQAPLRTQSQQLQPPAPSPRPAAAVPRLPLCLPASRSAAVLVRAHLPDRPITKSNPNSKPSAAAQPNTLRHVPSSPMLKQSYRQHPRPRPPSPVLARTPALTRSCSSRRRSCASARGASSPRRWCAPREAPRAGSVAGIRTGTDWGAFCTGASGGALDLG
ncbi:hypothetical protein B0H14DRAFT_866101 [Mycena olivaceomarginata]|nr:hypothetical protein B0H14DRAFT_866101 [Mycena olivaceomarginata]